MVPLSTLPRPLPPYGYFDEEDDMSVSSTTSAFKTKINIRDTFLGEHRCVVCGLGGGMGLWHCHIIKKSEPELWQNLKDRKWIPSQVKSHSEHEPRNGMLMCPNHHLCFNAHYFFIRFFPDIEKFVFINYSGQHDLQQFHGKAIGLDVGDNHVPFPSLFIIHEMRVRGFHPFQPVKPDVPDDIQWQDWISSDGIFNHDSGSFNHNGSVDNGSNSSGTSNTSLGCGKHTVVLDPLDGSVTANILDATHAMPSWKACQTEGTSWCGTAKENAERYISSIGIEDNNNS